MSKKTFIPVDLLFAGALRSGDSNGATRPPGEPSAETGSVSERNPDRSNQEKAALRRLTPPIVWTAPPSIVRLRARMQHARSPEVTRRLRPDQCKASQCNADHKAA